MSVIAKYFPGPITKEIASTNAIAKFNFYSLEADYIYFPKPIYIYRLISFASTSNSSYDIVTYFWDFGNGNSSFLKNPTTLFNTAGNYVVYLTITDTFGNTSTIKKDLVVMADTYSPQIDNLLLEQYRQTAYNLISICKSFASNASLLTDQCHDVRSAFDLDTSTHDQLDIIGELVGERRYERSDEDYRLAIRFTIFYNQANGTPEHLIASALDLSNADSVTFVESFPAGIIINIVNGTITDSVQFNTKMQKIVSSGVKLNLTVSATDPFAFFSDSEGLGFSDLTAPTSGGTFVSFL